MDYCVIDLETSIKNKGPDAVGDFKASPFHPDNKIVMPGYKRDQQAKVSIKSVFISPSGVPSTTVCVSKSTLLVGHNVGFDIQYLRKESEEWNEWCKTGIIWDTMIVEYLLTGQQSQYASLNQLAEKYGGTQKPDKIKEYWEAGVDTEDIPYDELREYLIGDVENTELIFLKQLEIADQLGMLPLIYQQMEARMATIEMEYNGMYFDVMEANMQCKDLDIELSELLGEIETSMLYMQPSPVAWNPNSPQHLSAFLFGGTIKYKDTEEVLDADGKPVRYKSGIRKGLVKTKKVDKYHTAQGVLSNPSKYSAKGKSGQWATGEAVLKRIVAANPSVVIKGLAEYLLEARKLSKDINAYYVGYPNLTWPTDNCIHPTYNHTATGTGRLSCSKPNLQQVSNKE